MFRFPWTKCSSQRAPKRRSVHCRHLACEPLERREVLASTLVSAVAYDGALGGVFPSFGDVVNDATGNTYVSRSGYLAKYGSDGQELWGYALDGYSKLTVGNSGALYFAGSMEGHDITIDGHTVQYDPYYASYSWFVGKIGPDGHVQWLVGYQKADTPTAIAVDELHQRVYVAGDFMYSYGRSIVVAFDTQIVNNATFAWEARTYSANSTATRVDANDLAVDSAGFIYAVGRFYGKVDFDPGSGNTNTSSGSGTPAPDAGYLLKLTPNGSLGWVKTFVGSTSSSANVTSIAVDLRSIADQTDDRLVIAGHFTGKVDLDPGKGTLNLPTFGGSDLFLLGFNQNGELARNANGSYALAKSYGTSLQEDWPTITLDGQGAIYIAARQQTAQGMSVIVLKYDSAGVLQPWSARLSAPNIYEQLLAVSVDPLTGRVNLIGASQGNVDADGDGVIDIYDSNTSTWDLFWCTYQ